MNKNPKHDKDYWSPEYKRRVCVLLYAQPGPDPKNIHFSWALSIMPKYDDWKGCQVYRWIDNDVDTKEKAEPKSISSLQLCSRIIIGKVPTKAHPVSINKLVESVRPVGQGSAEWAARVVRHLQTEELVFKDIRFHELQKAAEEHARQQYQKEGSFDPDALWAFNGKAYGRKLEKKQSHTKQFLGEAPRKFK